MPKKNEPSGTEPPLNKKRGRPTKYKSSLGEIEAPVLSVFDLQRKIGHRIRKPLINIIEHSDNLLSTDNSGGVTDIRATLGLISGSAYQVLDMYDWVLALFELTLLPSDVTVISPSQFISSLCLAIETEVPADLLGYRFIWSVPDDLPSISANGHLLQRALYLMIQLAGNAWYPGYAQLEVVTSLNELNIRVGTISSDPSFSLQKPELETLILESIARVCGGKFIWSFNSPRLELTLQLPIVGERS